MALVHTNTTVGTAATVLVRMPTGVKTTAIQIANRDSAAIYLGDSVITAASGANGGFPLAANASVQLWLNATDTVYAISAAGTSTGAVTVIYSGI